MPQRFAALPLVVGDGAEQSAQAFLDLLKRYPEIAKSVDAAVLVAERRWNLHLKSGLEVLLPEREPEQALRTLVDLDRDKKLLSRDIVAVDLRLADRVTVRQSDAAAAARDEALKAAGKGEKEKGESRHDRAALRPHAQDEAGVAAPRGGRRRSRYRHQQDRLPDRAARAAGAAGRAAPAQPRRARARFRPYRRERHEGRRRGRSGRGRGDGSPGHRHRRKHGRGSARIRGGIAVRRTARQRTFRRRYRTGRRRRHRRRYRPRAGGGQPPFGARRARGAAFIADRLCARRRRRHPRAARHARATASASTCTWSPPTWRPCAT